MLQLLSSPNAGWVMLAVMSMCAGAAVVGCFNLLSRRALAGDAVAHAVLPGICLAYMLAQSKHPLVLLIGAFASGWLGLWCVDFLSKHSRIKGDAALAIVLSVFYGLGIVLLTAIQASGDAGQSGLDKFLFGKAAAMVERDVWIFASFSAGLIAVVALWFEPFRMLVFDRAYAAQRGLHTGRLSQALSLLTVMAIALGIQAVGVVLMAAILIAPGAAARYWTQRLGVMLLLAGLIGAAAGLSGAVISMLLPRMPTGPWVVAVLGLTTFASALIGSQKGMLVRYWKQRRNRRTMMQENLLKCLYHLGEHDGAFEQTRGLGEIMEKRGFSPRALAAAARQLASRQLLQRSKGALQLTPQGVEAARRIVRLHRLWEMYLSTSFNLPPDHVHDDAEAMEHVITPEIEAALEQTLGYPEKDPHNAIIPR